MRLALIATPALLPDLRPAPGALDGDLLRVRLPGEDTDFTIVDLDPSVDLAEQLDAIFDRAAAGPQDPVLFYASCAVVISVEGELFLCLDPANPETGDALEDVTAVVRDRAPGPVLMVLECRHPPDPNDPFRSAAIVAAARAAVAPAKTGVGLLVAARPITDDLTDRASPFTRTFVEAVDELAGPAGATAEAIYQHILESEALIGVVPCFAHARGRTAFPVVPVGAALSEPAPPIADDDQDEGAEGDEVVGWGAPPREEAALAFEATAPAGPEDEAAARQWLSDTAAETAPMTLGEGAAAEQHASPAVAASEHADDVARAWAAIPDEVIVDHEEPEPEEDGAASLAAAEPTDEDAAPAAAEEPAVDEAAPAEGGSAQASEPETTEPAESEAEAREAAAGMGDDADGADGQERDFGGEVPPMSRRSSLPPTSLPHERSFLRVEAELPRVIVSDRPPPAAPVAEPAAAAMPEPEAPEQAPSSPPAASTSSPPQAAAPPVPAPSPPTSSPPSAAPSARPAAAAAVAPSSPPDSRGVPPSSAASPRASLAEHLEAGAKLAADEPEGALREYKAALGMLSTADKSDRGDIFVRIADIKTRQDKRREAISNFEKALTYIPGNRHALEALVDLNVHERDWRAVHGAEERLLGTLKTDDERFTRLVQFGDRWGGVAEDDERARRSYERAREIHPDDVGVLDKLRRLYETANDIEDAITTRRRIAELTSDPRARARQYYELGQYITFDLRREDEGLALFDLALESDPSMLEPLEVVATLLAERMDYAELERAYRRMLDRIHRVPHGPIRTEVTWELCRRLGLLFRDHLEDPSLALEAFEDAVEHKPGDVASQVSAAEMARLLHRFDRAALHLQAAAILDPTRMETFHDLFEVFQKLRSPDQAFSAACVTMHHRVAETRERFIFEEHRIEGVPKLARAVRKETWDLLRVDGRDRALESILAAIAPAAITMRLSQLAKEGRVPALDPASRQDPDSSTASIVRSFKWAAHFLSLPLPAIYVRDEPNLNLAAVPVEQPTVLAGGGVLRGKSLPELAFLVGRHLSYYLPPHRLLLYYASLEELSALFVAAVKVVLPELPIPKPLQEAAAPLLDALDARLGEDARVELARAVQAFEASGTPADLARWVGDVERCATRTGLLLCGDLEVAVAVVKADPRGVVGAEDKVGDFCGFIVSDAYFDLRRELGISIEP